MDGGEGVIMVKLKGETQGVRQKNWYKKRKIDQRNQAAFNAAHRRSPFS
jgi:hypothetical protein